MQDLGVPAGLACSTAEFINSKEQVVGDSGECNVGGHGWLWEKGGPPVELTSLIPASADLHISDAVNINDAGEIAAMATLPNGDQHAVLLVPCDGDHGPMRGCEASEERAPNDLGHLLPRAAHDGAEARFMKLRARWATLTHRNE